MSTETPALSSEEIAAAYIGIVSQVQQVNLGCIGAGALLIYDWSLCIGEEINLIWRSAWSIPKVLYIFSRYFAIIDLIISIVGLAGGVSYHLCRSFILLQLIGLPLLSFSSNYVLCLRLKALYNGNLIFVRFIFTVWLLEFTLGFLFSIIYAATLKLLPPGALFGLPLCLGQNPSQAFIVAPWVLSSSLSLFLFTAMMVRFIRTYKVDKLFPTPLMTRIVKDGCAFFAMDFAVLIVAACITLIIKNLLSEIAALWVGAAYSIVGSRLVLNIRNAAVRLSRGELNSSQSRFPSAHEQVSSLRFQSSTTSASSSRASGDGFGFESERDFTTTRIDGVSEIRSRLSDITEESESVVNREIEEIQLRSIPSTT